LEAEDAIVGIIKEEFPNHAVLGEETYKDDVSSPDLWIIDPLDGTNNFAHQLPHFAISVAYVKNGIAQAGVVYNPIHEELFIAERGKGAYLNGIQAKVGSNQKLNEVLVGCGFYYDRGLMMERTLDCMRDLFGKNIHGIRRMGTASLDLCMVGCGRFGAFFEYQLSPWDFAAGALFVEEAGGRISSTAGSPLAYEKSGVLASNGLLHAEMLEITGRHHP
jgi:myo-inositol-1(or 4)-monophosphatase